MAPLRQSPPVGGRKLLKFDTRGSRFGGMAGNRDFVAGLQNIFAQARHGERVRVPKFRAPMLHVTFFVRDVEQNTAVGIRPNPFGYRPLQVDSFFRVVGYSRSVVCEERAACEKNASD